ncbi:hypothetical protein D210916BOD24_10720 [Alteromonas sp. D210916BOD_24]|uniref:halomucin n=1 Tax=Alteromonas sp. D210916BOD_24 TaxID=3157618 RepID=UPI00399D3583
MKTTKILHILVCGSAALTISGCVLILPTADVSTNQPPEKVAVRIEQQAQRCWNTFQLPIDKDIKVVKRVSEQRIKLTASRMEGSTPQYPFLHVTITPSDYGSNVEVREGDFNLGTDLNLSSDVRRWAGGSSGCR